MNGNPRVQHYQEGDPTLRPLYRAGCSQMLFAKEDKRPSNVLITPSIWGMSGQGELREEMSPCRLGLSKQLRSEA